MNAKALVILIVSGGLFCASVALGGGPTQISGSQSGTLYLTNSPYIVTADILVPGGQTLTVEPGVALEFTNVNIGAYIDGTLIAHGTSGSPILFTSDKGVKQPGQWRVIIFRSTASTNCVMENCIVECAAAPAGGYAENIRFESAPSVLVTNCVVRNSAANGLTMYLSDPRVFNCVFSNNTSFAVAMRADCLPTLRSNTAVANGTNAIGVFGVNVSRSGTWTKDNLPYTVYEDVAVNSGVTLTIEPGTTIQFRDPNNGWYVDGTLVARGTNGSPILFTSDEAVKGPGQWKGLFFRSTATTNTILENCILECGASVAGGFGETVRFDSAPPVLLTNCVIRNSAANGVTMLFTDPRILGCTFSNNTSFALAMRADCLPTLRGNTALANGTNAIGVFGVNVNRSGTWTRDNLPYTVYEDTFINNGVTLTIEPGTTIQFRDLNNGWYVDGTLVARGTPGNPILFTSDEAVKAPGQWKGMDVRSTASTNTILENCIVECGASAAGGFSENIRFESAPAVLLSNCVVRSSAGNGLTTYLSDPRILGCTFSNNTSFALAMRADSLPTLRSNTASANGTNAIGVFGVNVSRSGTWTRDHLPYTVYEDTFINNGVTLTIDPGTTIQFRDPGNGWYVDGTLVARGTAGNPILFTSDEAVKGPGQWRGMDIRSTASTNTVFENCIVECGASVAGGFGENVRFESAPAVLLTNCVVRSSAGNGLTTYLSDPRILGCTFSNNTSFALAMRADSLPTLRGNTASANGTNAIGVFGFNASRSGTWTRDNLPYTVYEDLFIINGVTLTIEPGTTIQFRDPGTGCYVDGTLVARGTTLNPIVFTSDEAVKVPGQWKGIDIRSTATTNTVLENCTVEYGASVAGGFNGSLQFDSAPSVLITNCTIRSSTNDGIYCNLSSPLIRTCRITNNRRDGVRTVNGANPVVTNSAISSNLVFGMNNLDTTKIIKAQGNYWGHPSGPFDNANTDGQGLTNPSGLGDKVSEYVNWSSFLTNDPTVVPPNAPDIDVTPTNLNFGTIPVGLNLTLTLTVSNVGSATLNVNSMNSDNPRFSAISPATPFTVAAGAKQSVSVQFTPTTTNSQTGTLSIASDDPDEGTVNIPLSGTGTTTVVSNCATPAAGLVGWWPGDGNASDIVGGNNGTIAGSVTFPTGKVAQAFSFSSPTASVSIPDSAALRPANVTVEAWVRFDSLSTSNFVTGYQTLVCKNFDRGGGNYFTSYGLSVELSGGTFYFLFVFATANAELRVASTTVPTAGPYYHLVGSYDTTNINLYVNGVLEFSTPYNSPPLFYDSTPLLFGSSGHSPEQKFQGQLDEVSIYNRALTSSEIAAIYVAGSSGKCSSGVVSPVSLAVARSGGQVILSWPGSATGYSLQSVTHLPAATNAWVAVTNAPVLVGGQFTVTNTISGTNKYFRLRK